MTKRFIRAAGVLSVVAMAGLVLAVAALAATRHGVTPLAPAAGSTVPKGKSPTFKLKVRGKGSVWVYVCKSRKRDARGLICSDEQIEQARRTSAGRFQVKPRFWDYPSFWLNTPGTYYWQAHRIRCENGTKDCTQEGPVVKFKVG
jgi:hypothetical protein